MALNFRVFLTAFLFAGLASAPAGAADEAEAFEPRMSNFAEALKALRAASATLAERSERMMAASGETGGMMSRVVGNLTDLQGAGELWRIPVILAFMLLVGAAAEYLLRRRMAGALISHQSSRAFTFGLRLVLVIGFTIAGYLGSFVFLDRFHPMREFVVGLLLVISGSRLMHELSSFLIRDLGKGPLLAFAPAMVEAVHRFVVALSSVAIFATLSVAVLELLGLDGDLLSLYQLALGSLVMLGLLIGLQLVARVIMRGDGPAGRRSRPVWVILSSAFVVVAWAVWSFNILLDRPLRAHAASLSILLVLLIPLLNAVVARLLQRLSNWHLRYHDDPPAPPDERRLSPAARGILTLLRVVLIGAALVMLSYGWGIGIWVLVMESEYGRVALRAGFNIALTVLIALTLWETISIWIERRLALERVDEGSSDAAKQDGEGGTAVAATRTETLLPLIRSFFLFALITFVAMIILSSLGVDIGPLLAGAGVLGIAIGFGAQTLVRDVVSGIFFLIDDAFRLGEYIEMGAIRGEVEKISVRSIRLRHHRGAIHTIPFGELKSITNYNRDWVIFKMSIDVTYDTDIDKVKKIIKKIGAEMAADPEHGKNLLEPLKSQGVVEFSPHALKLRVKFKCRPREQFVLRRIAFQKIRDAFVQNGIAFAYPTVTVQVPEGKSVEEAASMAAASAEVLKPPPAAKAG